MRLVPSIKNFVIVKGASPKLGNFIRYEVASDYRYFEDGYWHVHLRHLQGVVDFAQKICRVEIDTRKLPASLTRTLGIEGEGDPYAVLHVARTAPACVVKAAYKALSLQLHPDQGGTAEQYIQLTTAYEQVLDERTGRD